MSKTKEELLTASNQVKNETQSGANSAERVGGLFYDIVEYMDENGGGTIPENVVTSSTPGLKIEVVSAMPAEPDNNTIYIVQ